MGSATDILTILSPIRMHEQLKPQWWLENVTMKGECIQSYTCIICKCRLKPGTQEEDKPMGAVSVFTTGNYHCQLLLRHGFNQCQLGNQPNKQIHHDTYTKHPTLWAKPKAIPTYEALYKMYRNTRIYRSFTQETTWSSRYECAGVCNGGKT